MDATNKDIINLRTIVNMISCEVSDKRHDSTDNLYINKIDLVYGPQEMPYNTALYFRNDEVDKLVNNLELLIKALREHRARLEKDK